MTVNWEELKEKIDKLKEEEEEREKFWRDWMRDNPWHPDFWKD